MRRLWLLFAQTVTVCLGILFIVATLRPEWLPGRQPGPVATPAAAQPPAAAAPGTALARLSFADAVAQATPSVVNVYTRKHVNVPLLPLPPNPELERLFKEIPGFSRRREFTNLGSGVIVRDDGYILTNFHVIEAADSIEVALSDGREAKATLVGADPESDLAVLKIDLPGLKAIAFNQGAVARTGDIVLAIGNPFGVGQTTTMGIVSAVGRNRLGINIYENFIQTDAAINPGNSGGALIDTSGNLVGINTAIYSETGGSLGIGFAIPARTAHTIMAQIIKTGTVTRGWLGIEPQDMTPDLARAFGLKQDHGVIIASILRDGPAARAGLRVGDIVLAIEGEPVQDSIGLLNQIAPLGPGKTAALLILRDGKQRKVQVEVGTRPPIRRR
ncbi:PDZ domain-containing protein [Allopusillimonas soli]|uniref:Trypsin-like peptidase domain-containing protein n=1 Tax=Allopusillimonas soli TaxID=659016 RepID=A0A853FHR8_9BURK|nr:trypsin-like peptidase domain-containing protein [Allopusillimonas soli]NYT37981.1 trypsin-like peptidase domain-containing protein [Allopusillimonas soli]TEA73877.1 PDZ domain-containing protein [Allopusillimonas soli]